MPDPEGQEQDDEQREDEDAQKDAVGGGEEASGDDDADDADREGEREDETDENDESDEEVEKGLSPEEARQLRHDLAVVQKRQEDGQKHIKKLEHEAFERREQRRQERGGERRRDDGDDRPPRRDPDRDDQRQRGGEREDPAIARYVDERIVAWKRDFPDSAEGYTDQQLADAVRRSPEFQEKVEFVTMGERVNLLHDGVLQLLQDRKIGTVQDPEFKAAVEAGDKYACELLYEKQLSPPEASILWAAIKNGGQRTPEEKERGKQPRGAPSRRGRGGGKRGRSTEETRMMSETGVSADVMDEVDKAYQRQGGVVNE